MGYAVFQQGVKPMSEKKRRPRRKVKERTFGSRMAGTALYVLLVMVVSAVLATVGWVWASDVLALNKEYASTITTIPADSIVEVEKTDEEGKVYTARQANIEEITAQLEAEGMIEYGFLFRLYAWFSGAEEKITAGTYSLDTNMDYRALVVNMGSSSATRQTIDVTIPEGYTVDQIFRLLEENGVSTAEALTDMAANWPYKWDFLQEIPLGDRFFDNGPMLFGGMDAQTVTLRSEKSGRFVEMGIAGFPDLCLWGVPSRMSLIAIEPWIGTTDRADTDHIWEHKPHLQCLQSGQENTHRLTFRVG